ncbi:MAG: hypothetical protein KTR21_04215 [Rhodobacteraceae bacterium]|nr:hypothetical protein [Paracoccaceae bacterium]
MAKVSPVWAPALLAMVTACGAAPEQGVPLEPYEFEFAGRELVIDLPPGSSIVAVGESIRIETQPGTRASPTLSLRYLGAAPPDSDDIWLKRHFTQGAGSGGNQADLEGWFRVGGDLYGLSCFILGDTIDANDAEWCLPLVRSLRLERE